MEVIEWLDETGEGIVQRIPAEGSGETKLGAQLIVRDSQAAIFFKTAAASTSSGRAGTRSRA